MLKKIPKILSPELVKTLMEMGHGDEIVIADGNFPSASIADKVIRADGISGPALLEAVMELLPLDTYAEHQVYMMDVVRGDDYYPEIWHEYKKVLNKSGEPYKVKLLERFEFYERARKTYAIVATGEEAQYANIILKKGVVK